MPRTKALLILLIATLVTLIAIPAMAAHDSNDPNTAANVADSPPPRPPTDDVSHELLKTQIERDAYNQTIEILKSTQNIIISLLLGFIATITSYMIWRNQKEYKDALAEVKDSVGQAREAGREAREACSNARTYEDEARTALSGIKKEARATFDALEIDLKATIDARVAQKLEEIEKEAEEQRQKSEKRARDARQVSELSDKALKADKDGDHASAAEVWRKVASLAPDDSWVYNSWGCTLGDFAESKEGPEAEALYQSAFEKFAKAVEIEPDYHEAFSNWACALINLYASKRGQKDRALLAQAKEKALKAEAIERGSAAYNLACVAARQRDPKKCRKWLKVAEEAGTLASRKYAMTDDDLQSVRSRKWFKELKWKGEK